MQPPLTQAGTYKLLLVDNLFDGTGGPPRTRQAVLIEGDSIAAVGPAADVRAPDGAPVEVIAYEGATALPGLVDGHTHMMAPGDGTLGDDVAAEADDLLLVRSLANARTFLHAGVTTARENGSKNRVGFSLREGIRRGLSEGPDMVVCGRPVTITGGHMWYCGSEADGEDGVRREVRALVKEGADFIKIMATGGSTRSSDPLRPSYTARELAAIVDEAHRASRLTATHCASMDGIANSVEAGVDMVIHCVFVDETGMYRYRDDLADQLARAGAWVNPTLHIVQAGIDHLERLGRERGWTTHEEQARIDGARRSLDTRMDTVGRLVKLGVRMIAGSDSPWGAYPPGEVVKEIQALGRAGLSNAEALLTATSQAAESIAAGDRAGRLLPGRPADILVVGGNPLDDLACLWDVRDVFKAGRRVVRARG